MKVDKLRDKLINQIDKLENKEIPIKVHTEFEIGLELDITGNFRKCKA